MSDRGNVVPMAKQSGKRLIARDAERPSETWLTAQIVAMLSIYYQPDEDADVAKLGLALWVDCLSDLPRETIERAIRRRLSSPSRSRPVPGEIRELAMREMETVAAKPRPYPFGPGAELSEGERRRVVEALSDLSRELGGVSVPQMREGSVDRIVKVAAQVCGVPLRDVRGSRRTTALVQARFLSCLAARQHTNATWAEIGAAFGGRDHSSIIHASSEAEKRIGSDPRWAEAWTELNRRLGE